MQVSYCGYFEWHDDEVSGRAKIVINELKMENMLLVASNKQLKEMVRENGGFADDGIQLEIGNL